MGQKVEHSIAIAAPPERVWRAWVEDMNRWWVKPYYNDAERATGHLIEPALGGRVIEQWGEGGSGWLIGTVIEWLPPQRLAYTWTERSFAGAMTLIELVFAAETPGTRLTFTHSGLDRLEDAETQLREYGTGWADLLGHLKHFTEKR